MRYAIALMPEGYGYMTVPHFTFSNNYAADVMHEIKKVTSKMMHLTRISAT